MSELYLTPTRRDLLTAVHEQRVLAGSTDDHHWLVEEGYPNRRVCARIVEAERAGWVELSDDSPFWRLTSKGGKALLGITSVPAACTTSQLREVLDA